MPQLLKSKIVAKNIKDFDFTLKKTFKSIKKTK